MRSWVEGSSVGEADSAAAAAGDVTIAAPAAATVEEDERFRERKWKRLPSVTVGSCRMSERFEFAGNEDCDAPAVDIERSREAACRSDLAKPWPICIYCGSAFVQRGPSFQREPNG